MRLCGYSMRQMVRRSFPLLAAVAAILSCAGWAADRPALLPQPRIGEWLEGSGSTTPITVETVGHVRTAGGKGLVAALKSRLPGGKIPAEGYLLEVGPGGAIAVVADPAGRVALQRTMRQLPAACPRLRIADWPDMAWRGLHVLDSGPGSLPQILRLIHEVLPAHKCNVLVYEIDYNFRFVSHPEIPGPGAWTRTEVGAMVEACREEGIRLIPEINCLGHQSWKKPPGELLAAHPEIEEIPDGRIEETDLTRESFYCRSWCISNPDTNRIVFPLIDELLDAFQADAFHCGMDEVFVIASDKCPRCRGKDPAKLFAKQVNDFHRHLAAKHVQMLMWADRLLDGKATGYGDWDASTVGTAPAIDLVPKDIIQCDWHYDWRETYPSLRILPAHGFRMWPTVYSDLRGARKFMADAQARRDPKHILGVLTSIWVPASQMEGALLHDPAVKIDRDSTVFATTAAAALDDAWSGPAGRDLGMTPEKTTFLGAVDVTLASAGSSGEIHYTTDGTPPSPASPRYTTPIHLAESTTLMAAFASADGVSMRTVTRRYERLVPAESSHPQHADPGLAWTAFRADPPGFEKVGDLDGLKPAASGTATALDISVSGREQDYGLVFSGWLEVPADGLYTFSLASDDGSQLWLDGRLVVDADGLHQAQPPAKGEAALKAGKHAIRIPYIQARGGASLDLSWQGPAGLSAGPIPSTAYAH